MNKTLYISEENRKTPQEIIDYIKENNIKAVKIILDQTALDIPTLLKLKKENNLNTKFIFGISLNIKYDELYVPSIILVKNKQGLKNLYEIITLMNKNKRKFLTNQELKNYQSNLIYGISHDNFTKNYQKVIKNYQFIEVTRDMTTKDLNKLKRYALKNNILLNINNKIDKEIEDYNIFDLEINLFKCDGYNLRKEVYERCNLLYLDEIPNNVKKRIEEELKIIYKYHLEDTFFLIEALIKKARRNSYAHLSGYLSNTLLAYVLGFSEINIINLNNKRNLEKDILKYGYTFRIDTTSEEIPQLQEYLRRLTNQKDIYYKGTYKNNFEGIYEQMGIIPNTCYIIPNNIDILNYTPLNYLNDKAVTCLAYTYLDKHFASIYFANTIAFDLINILEKKCHYYIEDIPLNLKEVIDNIYEIDDNYNSLNFVLNHYLPEIRMGNCQKSPQPLEELINLNNTHNANFQSKVIRYYYLNYYKIKYPYEFYDTFLHFLTDHFNLNKIYEKNFLTNFEKCIQEKRVVENIEKEDNQGLKVIKIILNRIYKLELTQMLMI